MIHLFVRLPIGIKKLVTDVGRSCSPPSLPTVTEGDQGEDGVCHLSSFRLCPCVCVCVTQLPFREHLLYALLLRGKGDVCTLAAEQLVLRPVHTHDRWRLEFIREVLTNTSVNGPHK